MIRHILINEDLVGVHSKSFIDDTAGVKAFCEVRYVNPDIESYLAEYRRNGYLRFTWPTHSATLIQTEIY